MSDEQGPEHPPGTEGDPAPEATDAPEPASIQAERRYPSTIGGLCYLGVLLVTGAGLVTASLGSWRLGIQLVAGSLVVAALLRLALPQRDAGMLAVRSRWVDALLLGAAAAAFFFLTATIPNQPG